MKTVSLVCTTFKRYRCIRRIIEQFMQQDYGKCQLVLFNTDTEHPFVLDQSLSSYDIIVVNNSVDYETLNPYTNRGAICRDAVTHATGEYFMLMDDDDIYLPWYVRQAVDGIIENGKDSWKPEQSFFATSDRVCLVKNTLEASVIVKMNRIREIGFRTDMTGYEGLSWYTKLRDEGNLNENDPYYVPAYCFNWSDPAELAGHKQSGDINNPNNFENHKVQSTDWSTDLLTRCGPLEIRNIYQKYYDFLIENKESFIPVLWGKYISLYIQ